MRSPSPARVAAYTQSKELNFQAVVLADDAKMASWHLEIQRTLLPDAQDLEDDMDAHCVVLPSGATCYGCLDAVDITEDLLRLKFRSEALEELSLGDDNVIEIDLALEASTLPQLITGLRSIFGNDRKAPTLGGLLATAGH